MDDEQIGPHGDAIDTDDATADGAASAEPVDRPDSDGAADSPNDAAADQPADQTGGGGREDAIAAGHAESGQTALPVAPEPTGISSVDAALDRLADLEQAPLDTHVEVFDDVQRQLHDALAELDDEQ
jgi:hypothetical protein